MKFKPRKYKDEYSEIDNFNRIREPVPPEQLAAWIYYNTYRNDINKLSDNNIFKWLPNISDYYGYLGDIFLEKEQYDITTHFYKKSIEIDSTNINTYLSKVKMYLYKKEYDNAIDVYNKIISIDKNYKAESLYRMGLIYEKMNDSIQSKKMFEECLKEDPNYKRVISRYTRFKENQTKHKYCK